MIVGLSKTISKRIITMNTNVNLSVVASNRKPLSMIGANLGAQYFKAQARASWPNFEQEKMQVAQNGDIDFCLNRTPRRYRLTGHDVISVQVGVDGTGTNKVYINKGDESSEVAIPITPGMEKIGVVVEDAVGKALRGDNGVIFSDPKKLAALLNSYNNDEKTRVNKMIAALQAVTKQLDSAIAENNKKAEDYCREMLASTPQNLIPGTVGADGMVVVNVHNEN